MNMNIFDAITDFILNTKVGHFLFIFVFTAVFGLIINLIFHIPYLAILAGGFFGGIVLSALDSSTSRFI